MRFSTLVLLSLAGNRTDRLRTVLTAGSAALAALALLAAATVASISGGAWIDTPGPTGERIMSPGTAQYASPLLAEAGLRPGVIFALVMLALPVLALAGQCIRLGAPARDRRLAALRLGGATPGQAVLIAGAETAAASLLGSVLGLGVFLAVRETLDLRSADGRLWLPVDQLPGPVLTAGALLLVPLVAGAIGVLLMRRVLVTPLGVVRRAREDGPGPWPGVLIAVGLVAFAAPGLLPVGWEQPDWLTPVSMGCAVLLVTVGVVLGVGWISYTAGRLLRRYGRGPATLLAGGRLMADPWNGSRTLGALLGAIVFGAGTLGFRAHLATDFEASRRYEDLVAGTDFAGIGYGTASDQEFYFGAIRLVMIAVSIAVAVAAAGVLVAFVEGIVARRRAYAALTATGVPRRTLSAVLLWHTFVPLVPAVLLALGTGAALFRLTGTEVRLGGPYEQCVGPAPDPAACVTETIVAPLLVMSIPIPFAQLALLGGGALLAMLLVVGVGAAVLRSSTDLEELRVG
ncbi:FtsX-like permease family protein [Actinoplanes sp. DH11]|uniref:FtsX-like permease family protein n=1 Tax=Actinoplanes sp. DH11 TaxID=2857011 RepID=UPI001E447A81|nr:FtsX-like permease family protein [Actinoplanes sp. DH11]